MNGLAWGTNNDLNDNQFYNRVEDIKFISDLLKSSQYGISPSILITGIAKKLNVTSGAIGRSLKKLQENGLIEMENNKYYMPNFVFKSWLKNEYKTKGVYPYKSI